jgi:hypothetical protein
MLIENGPKWWLENEEGRKVKFDPHRILRCELLFLVMFEGGENFIRD